MGLRVTAPTDWRTTPVEWRPLTGGWRARLTRVLLLVNVLLAIRYLTWLLTPGRAAQPVLYGLLVGAEVFNMIQGAGFWWTVSGSKRPRSPIRVVERPAVDVFIPTYNEPVEVVEPTVVAAMRLRGAEARVALLDDGNRPEMGAMARRHGAAYVTRPKHEGAKAGNINWAMERTDAPFVAVLDCDHV